MPADDSHWPEILTVAQVAEWLQVNPYTVREEARRGHLPGRKVGREWRFSRAAILAWLHGDPPETLR
uniref:DNA-binding domain protein n=1 Tax=Sulfobacillus thermotolerans TaxID=338644 RepID=G5CJ57_9FIRM|nr:helix-turn-helix domain-containing protein [Sulfobacillus thermotolerans]AEP14334.1 DNA-binding domain protein [Sulfobacillus thermotolerans]